MLPNYYQNFSDVKRTRKGDLEYVTYLRIDDHTTPDTPDPENYTGCTPEEIAEYMHQDMLRVKSFEDSLWCYVGVCCDINLGKNTVGTACDWNYASDDRAGIEYALLQIVEEAEKDMCERLDALQRALSAERLMMFALQGEDVGGVSK